MARADRPWRQVDPTAVGRHWALPGEILERLGVQGGRVQEKLDALDAASRIFWPKKEGGTPRLKWFADELAGSAMPDVWSDIPPISARAAERLGYPTQKPRSPARAHSEGEQQRRRRGARPVLRLRNGGCRGATAEPPLDRDRHHPLGGLADQASAPRRLRRGSREDLRGGRRAGRSPGARALAAQDPYQFQWWALGLVGARPVEQKKGADKGIDGRLFFHDDAESQKTKQIVLSVKSGSVHVAHVRDLRGVVEREKAAIGVLITLEEPTRNMRAEAAGAGFYESPWQTKHPRFRSLRSRNCWPARRSIFRRRATCERSRRPPRRRRSPRAAGSMFLF